MIRRQSSPRPDFDAYGSRGLNLLWSPADPLLDLVFVHGLGGGSTKTWCFSEDPTKFWPKAWLPRETGFANIRIHSYGYDADWQSTNAASTINVYDFAVQLLNGLRNSPCLANQKTTPIVFVAHSMGGLVVKQAYVIAHRDLSLADLAKRVEAMVFLATPHRGSNLAKVLNNILRASVVLTGRSYISNLDSQNEILSQLNDAFRHYVADVELYSFSESRPTKFYLQPSELIVRPDSAVLGYPRERHAMLDADHRQICKFESPSDPNHTAVRDALRSLTGDILKRISAENAQETWQAMRQIENFLLTPPRPDDDLNDVQDARIAGSCEWLAANTTFQRWVDPDAEEGRSIVYWISANPGTGKSVLTGYVIDSLQDMGLDCSYYFFRHGDKDKSTVGGFLRSLLYQMAFRSSEVRQKILAVMGQGVRLGKGDAKTIWRQLGPIIYDARTPTTTHYWVLDALDECSGFEFLFTVMASIQRHACIRILITSRKLLEIAQKFADLRRNPKATISILEDEICLENTKTDIRLYLEDNRDKLHVGSEEQKDAFSDRLLGKSGGSFLWARTVLDELESAWSVSQVEAVLDEVPPGMNPLYSRALAIMSARPKRSRDLARAILTWIVCSVRPLTVVELSEALKLDLNDEVPELEKAVASLCAQLVHIDKTGRAMMVHLTARTFLTNDELESEFRIDEKLGHVRLAKNCLRFLCSEEMKLPRGRQIIRKQPPSDARPQFTGYACVEFGEHLRRAAPLNAELNSLLNKFLGANVLSWIEHAAAVGDLSVLTKTADSMRLYLQRHAENPSPLSNEFLNLAQNWVVDLRRVVTGFGPSLLQWPWGVYWWIAPFCPKSSAFAATASQLSRITITGLRDKGWNDLISCFIFPDIFRFAVACGDTIFAIGGIGSVTLYDNNTCLPWKTLNHDGKIGLLEFDHQSIHLVSGTTQEIKVWDVETGLVCWTAEFVHDIVNLSITKDGKTLVTTDVSDTLTFWSMQSGEVERTVDWNGNKFFSATKRLVATALSPGASLLGVLYEDRPVLLYSLEDGSHTLIHRYDDAELNPSPTRLVFNPRQDKPMLVVAYEKDELCLFDYKKPELLTSVQESVLSVVCSPDGSSLAILVPSKHGSVLTLKYTMQLLEFDTLRLVYQISYGGYPFKPNFSFSADNSRLISVSLSECQVWEPTVLLGKAKRGVSSAEPPECEPLAAKETDPCHSEITSIQPDNTGSGQHFFLGREDGSVSVCKTTSGEQPKVLYRHDMGRPVNLIAWGPERYVIVSLDERGGFMVVDLLPDPELGWMVKAIHA